MFTSYPTSAPNTLEVIVLHWSVIKQLLTHFLTACLGRFRLVIAEWQSVVVLIGWHKSAMERRSCQLYAGNSEPDVCRGAVLLFPANQQQPLCCILCVGYGEGQWALYSSAGGGSVRALEAGVDCDCKCIFGNEKPQKCILLVFSFVCFTAQICISCRRWSLPTAPSWLQHCRLLSVL